MTQLIALSGRHGVGKYLTVDDGDAHLVTGYTWSLHHNGHGGWYTQAYVPGSGAAGKRMVTAHELITGQKHVDHANGDPLDNTRRNLRPATFSQQNANRSFAGGSSRFKGVYWSARKRKWHAHIQVDGRKRHLGTFADEELAARAYDAAARAAWGAFARPNFPAGLRSAR